MIIGWTDATIDLLISAGAFLLLVMIILGYRLFREYPNPKSKRFRIGLFIERDRITEESEEGWPEFDPEKTAEYPPRKEEEK